MKTKETVEYQASRLLLLAFGKAHGVSATRDLVFGLGVQNISELPAERIDDFLGALLKARAKAKHERSTAQQRIASSVDPIGHSSVQPWSAGDIFPFVIVRTEHYGEFSGYLRGVTWQAINGPGDAETARFYSYDACRQAAIDHLALVPRRVVSPAGPVFADGLVPAEMGVMCGGDADATAADLNDTRIEAIPRLAREYVDLTPEARSRLMEKSRAELFADAEANPADQQTTLE